METRELSGRSFACLEGCGFCCTFQPEASQRELALLRQRLKPRALPVVVGDGRSYLGLQNKCGACTLLERRACQAYDLRPAHCRYFPFHVHFGARPQVYVNYTCRGIEHAQGGDLAPAFQSTVLDVAKRDEWERHEREGRATYAEFERRARKAGAWGDARAVAADALARGDVLTRAWVADALARAGEEAAPEDLLGDALTPFSAEDVTQRPFYLAPDLRWLTFEGPTRVVEMDERGDLAPVREIPPLLGWQDLAVDLAPYLRALVERDSFVGSVYAIVDEHDYGTSVEEATWFRLAEVAADLHVRARILRMMDVPPERLADEVARFYDSTFLDAPTIGGFL